MKLIPFIILVFTILSSLAQTPVPFLPEIMNTYPNVRDIAISPDGNELYFTIQSYKKEYATIAQLKKENGVWTNISICSFAGKYTDIEPALSTDGLKLFFASNRPRKGTAKTNDFDIWFVERSQLNSEWSTPTNLGPVINSDKNEFYPSIAANNNLYFTASIDGSKGEEDIFMAKFEENKYQKPVSLSEAINTDGWEFNAYIAPDELFIIFTSTKHENNLGSGDLYISFKNNSDEWLPAENLGLEINSPKLDFCPYVDAKTNTFYFSSEKTNIDKSFDKTKDINELLHIFNNNSNGLSRIYYTNFSTISK